MLGSGLDAVVLRVFSPVGPGTPAGSPLGRLAEAMRRAMQPGDGELKLGGLGVQRDFVDVRDVARAVHAASLSAAQGVVNIGTGRAVRLRDAAAVLARVAGYAGPCTSWTRPGRCQPGLDGLRPAAPARRLRQRPVSAGSAIVRTGTCRAAPPYPYPDGCGSWQQADVRTARDRLGWRPRIGLEESLADIWMEAACRI